MINACGPNHLSFITHHLSVETMVLREWIRTHLKGDRQIWWIVLYLSIMSVLVVYSATGTKAFRELDGNTEVFLLKHGSLLLIGIACTYFAHKINYVYYARLSKYGLWLSVPLLLWAFFKGATLNDASRWVTIPIINQTFQPSDLAKLALISNLAAMLAKRQRFMSDPSVLFNLIIWIALICSLIILSNTSTALLLGATCFLLMYIGRVPVRYLGYMIAACILFGGIALAVGQRLETAVNRVAIFTKSDTLPYQVEQSYIALANGGITGQGPGNSHQRNTLPNPFSDFIYAIIEGNSAVTAHPRSPAEDGTIKTCGNLDVICRYFEVAYLAIAKRWTRIMLHVSKFYWCFFYRQQHDLRLLQMFFGGPGYWLLTTLKKQNISRNATCFSSSSGLLHASFFPGSKPAG